MTFREQLDRAQKCAVDVGAVFIAREISEYEGFSCILTPEEFEHLCHVAYDLWLNYKYSVSAIVDTIGSLVSSKSYKPLEINQNTVMENYNED